MFNKDGAWQGSGVWRAGSLIQRRFALLIACNNYGTETGVRSLKCPLKDAAAIKPKLEAAGFACVVLNDKNKAEMEAAIAKLRTLLEPGDEVLIYFSGHGMELHGWSYLIPSGYVRGLDLSEHAVSVRWIQEQLDPCKIRCAMFLDCCRDSAAATPCASTASANAIAGSSEFYIVFATHSGGFASEDYTLMSSLFTACWLPHLSTPGLDIQKVFLRTYQDYRQLQRVAVPVGQFGAEFILHPTVEQVDAMHLDTPAWRTMDPADFAMASIFLLSMD